MTEKEEAQEYFSKPEFIALSKKLSQLDTSDKDITA